MSQSSQSISISKGRKRKRESKSKSKSYDNNDILKPNLNRTFNPDSFENPLLLSRVCGKTHDLYKKAVDDFVKYHKEKHNEELPIMASYTDLSLAPIVDMALFNYLSKLHTQKKKVSASRAQQVIQGMYHFYPHLKDKLPYGAQVSRGWLRSRPSKPRVPVPWEIACTVAVGFAAKGMFDFGAATLIAFEGYLRISELIGITVSDVFFPPPSGPKIKTTKSTPKPKIEKTAIRLAITKTGPDLSFIVQREPLVRLLRILVFGKKMKPNERLFGFSVKVYRANFKDMCYKLGFGHFCFVPHSFRHGAASCASQQGMKVEDIAIAGRWRSIRSLMRYLQSAKALYIKYEKERSHAAIPNFASYEPSYIVDRMIELLHPTYRYL